MGSYLERRPCIILILVFFGIYFFPLYFVHSGFFLLASDVVFLFTNCWGVIFLWFLQVDMLGSLFYCAFCGC